MSATSSDGMDDNQRPEIERKEIELDKLIGEGAFGKVYRGKARGKDVAVKVFKKENVSNTDLENFREEVKIMSKIYHPNILLFMGACTQGDEVMIVTPIMPTDLETLLIQKKSDQPISLYQRLRMMKDAALGMNWLHESNPVFIHRDLKLSNLLVDDSLRVYVCDFGLTRMKPRNKDNLAYDPHGSPLYMAPEVFVGDFNEKCDVYSFAICLWEALTQEQAFAHLANNLPGFIHAVVDRDERPKIPKNTGSSLKRLIRDCWKPKPADRPSFREIIKRLDRVLVDTAISDDGGRALWKRKALLGKEEVSWNTFVKEISKVLNREPNPNSIEFKCLKAMLVQAPKKKLGKKEIVNVVYFGKVLDWFGPFSPDADGQDMIHRVQNTLRQKWFHGDIGAAESEDKLRGQGVGAFLVRFSGQQGFFTISNVGENNTPIHRRVQYVASRGAFYYGEHHYSSLKSLIRKHRKKLGFDAPCPGSKYIALFQTSSASSSSAPQHLYAQPTNFPEKPKIPSKRKSKKHSSKHKSSRSGHKSSHSKRSRSSKSGK
mmetsp:Transcript_16662/g.24878  ORF Transcript_16662/g.24878 Transcript_16662/m.24878 type:complete len:544 (+) Transcript_16662:58-1689(+)|eukprot:CAMPEP_0201548210 /NCGR_PEP_ID=MMETSP0173_2-20130828/4750_1 /ASSEMBLY_ACC=CAM_ASM_000268 /TAXON_ID=218659 /ORGANISM="Vexillifera sp., Strain DIVA3 564/2" /LENGTH=543 /DNA_ID=CAMNT_0047957521 /DNA_START=38 /DNA_END=1669 /DNA_ORIENTATION=-